jgi:ankyrin repeat protein
MNAINYDRNTALHLAANFGHLEVVRYLLSIGVRINPENRWGSTPLNLGQKHPAIDFLLR